MNKNRQRNFALVAIFLLAVATAGPTQVAAEGALAVGIAPGGASVGYSFGIGINEPTTDAARAKSLSICKTIPMSSGAADNNGAKAARAQCAVVATFRNKCVTMAWDPKDGSPGAGWAVASTQKAADAEALIRCRSTAGPQRRGFCITFKQLCDGSAK